MSSGFVKIYGSILRSSVWLESKDTRLVWIAMLAMADKNGIVEASVGGLAHHARVSPEECREALRVLSSPDPDDSSGVDEGRRIRAVRGGWEIVNHRAYREREGDSAERMRRSRSAKREREAASQNRVTCDDVTANSNADLVVEEESRTSVVDLTARSENTAGSETAGAREPTPPRPTVPSCVEEPPSSHAVAVREPARTLAPTRAGRVYRGRLASSGEIDQLDWWRREVLAALTPAQRARVPGFTADVAELGPGLARALDQHGELTVRNVVGWATAECAAGRMSPRHYRALFNGDSFELRVVEAAAHVAGEASDQHAVSPELAAAIATTRGRIEHNRRLLDAPPGDDNHIADDLRPAEEANLRRLEAYLAELLAQGRKNGASR